MTQAIKSMKLSSAVERIHHELEEAGFSREDALSVSVLEDFYATMVRLFEGGHLGGVRYTAVRG